MQYVQQIFDETGCRFYPEDRRAVEIDYRCSMFNRQLMKLGVDPAQKIREQMRTAMFGGPWKTDFEL